jgi:hypothetical protein
MMDIDGRVTTWPDSMRDEGCGGWDEGVGGGMRGAEGGMRVSGLEDSA